MGVVDQFSNCALVEFHITHDVGRFNETVSVCPYYITHCTDARHNTLAVFVVSLSTCQGRCMSVCVCVCVEWY